MPLGGRPGSCGGEVRKGGAAASPGPPAGLVVAPGRGRPPGSPGLALPRSNGEAPVGGPGGVGLADGGVGFAPGGIRPGLPVAAGETSGAPAAAGAVGAAPTAVGGLPAPRAAAPVGGGTFLGFSVLIFCFSCASFCTPAQPRLSFGCATFVFTVGGLAVGGALANLGGAATTSLFPCTLVSAPLLAAAPTSTFVWRSIFSR